MKALRVLTITENHDSREWITLKLYKEGDKFVWRLGGELGDAVGLFEPSTSLRDAMNNATRTWGRAGSPWKLKATWLK